MQIKILSVFLMTILLLITFPQPTKAANLYLSVSPSLTHLKLSSPDLTTAPLTLQNQSDYPTKLKISFKPFYPEGENGHIKYNENNQIPNNYKNIFSRIKILDGEKAINSLELAPGQKKQLKIQINIPEKEKPRDYYFSVIFLTEPTLPSDLNDLQNTPDQLSPSPEEQPESEPETIDSGKYNQLKNYSLINAAIAANFLLSINPSHPSGTIEEFSAPAYVQSGPVDFKLRVKNTGSHVFKPKGVILITNMFGQKIGRIDVKPDNILSGTVRSLNSLPSKNQQNQVMSKIQWNENLLIGPYNSTLTLSLSEKGPIYNQSIIFFAFPLYLIYTIIPLILFLLYLIYRIKHHTKYNKKFS